MGLRYQEAEAM